MLKIAFVTDGGSEIGMGHVQQSTTLAKELIARGADVYFLTQSDDIVARQITRFGFKTFRLHDDDEETKVLHEMKPHIVIIDKLEVNESFARTLKNTLSPKLVIFSNITTAANAYADIAVCAYVGRNLRFRDEKTRTLCFYGPRYWILRKEFYELHGKGKIPPTAVEKILLIFGGSDPSNLTSQVLDELINLRAGYKIDVILGAHFVYLDAFNRVLQRHQEKGEPVIVHRDVDNVAELMYKADLVIVSPGLSAFEALCVGTPIMLVSQNSLQRQVYERYIAVLEKDDVGKLGRMIADAEFVDPRNEKIAKMEIGQGLSEVIDAILDAPNESSKQTAH